VKEQWRIGRKTLNGHRVKTQLQLRCPYKSYTDELLSTDEFLLPTDELKVQSTEQLDKVYFSLRQIVKVELWKNLAMPTAFETRFLDTTQ
jgi:hypothetical protein